MFTIDHTTRFIFPAEGLFPLTLRAIHLRHPNILFPPKPTAETLMELGYHVVHSMPRPVGEVVTEIYPVQGEDDLYYQTYEVREYNTEEQLTQFQSEQRNRLSAVEDLRTQALAKGTPIDFGEVFGVKHIQMRDGDRANILGLRVKAEAAIAIESTDLLGIRSYENVLVPLTPQEVLTVSWLVLSGYEEVMMSTWNLQDLVNGSEQMSDLPELPATLLPAVRQLA